jgi:hypothetical protein
MQRCAKTNKAVTWRLVEESVSIEPVEEYDTIGVCGINWRNFIELKERMKQRTKDSRVNATIPYLSISPFFNLFLMLWPGDWKNQIHNLNTQILAKNESNRRNQSRHRPIALVSDNEFFVFIGIMIAAAPAGKGGAALFECSRKRYNSGVRKISAPINYSSHMSQRRFEELRPIFHLAFTNLAKSNKELASFDPYFPIIDLVDDFNKNRKTTIAASSVKVLDGFQIFRLFNENRSLSEQN